MADDARPRWTMLDCVSVDTQLCDYRPSCRIQNNYFKIKYALLMGWECQSAADHRTVNGQCRVLIVNCGLSDSRQSNTDRLSDSPTVGQSGHRWSDSPTVSWSTVGLSDS